MEFHAQNRTSGFQTKKIVLSRNWKTRKTESRVYIQTLEMQICEQFHNEIIRCLEMGVEIRFWV